MQADQPHLRRRIYNTVPGFLQGPCPNGPAVTVWHQHSGRTGFRIYWNGFWRDSFGQQELDRTFGISPRVKKTGSQKGYPSEPVIQAVWRYLAKRYNEGDPNVIYSKSQPNLKGDEIRIPSRLQPSNDDLNQAIKLAANRRRSGTGESDAHKTLKNRIAKNPEIIGTTAVSSVFVEHQFLSSDRVDLLLESSGSKWTVVEVELEGLVETVTGLFQAIK